MKTPLKYFLLLPAFVLLLVQHLGAALVSTGTVTKVDHAKGTLTIFSHQTQAPMRFSGLSKIAVQYADGTPTSFANVALSQVITIEYSEIDGDLLVTKIKLPAPEPLLPMPSPGGEVIAPPPAAVQGMNSAAARDGDITTQPGRKAMIDGDVTTEPGRKAEIDGDVTTQPGVKAEVDGDITTEPGITAPTDPDITKNTDE